MKGYEEGRRLAKKAETDPDLRAVYRIGYEAGLRAAKKEART